MVKNHRNIIIEIYDDIMYAALHIIGMDVVSSFGMLV